MQSLAPGLHTWAPGVKWRWPGLGSAGRGHLQRCRTWRFSLARGERTAAAPRTLTPPRAANRRSVKRPPLRPFRGRMRSKAAVPAFSAPGSRSEEDTFSKDTGVGVVSGGFTCALRLPCTLALLPLPQLHLRSGIQSPSLGTPQPRAWAPLSVLWADNKGFLCFCWLWGHQQKDLTWGRTLEGQ